MSPTLPSLKRAAVALVLLNAFTVAVVVVCFESARHSQERSEEAVVSLANDMTQVSQAEGAAERMVAIGRAYLLANEPELLLRAQAADAKLGRTVQTIAASTADGGKAEPRAAAGIRETVSRRVQRPSFWEDAAPRSKGDQRKPAQTPHSGPRGPDRPAGSAGHQEARRAGRGARAGPPWSRAQPRPDARSLESWAWPRASFWRLSSAEAAVSVVRTRPNRSDRAVAPVGDRPRRGAPP